MKKTYLIILTLISALSSVLVAAEPVTTEPAKKEYPYPLSTCVISGEPLTVHGKPIVLVEADREVKLCCKMCVSDFKKTTAESLAKLDQAVIEQQLASYPLDTCVISGEKLGEHGKVVEQVYKNRLVRLCCKSCIEDFLKDPEKHLKTIDDAAAAKKKS